jgi:hypothetical protein
MDVNNMWALEEKTQDLDTCVEAGQHKLSLANEELGALASKASLSSL